MINFLMFTGLIIFFVGTIGCLITTIVMAVKKEKKAWIPSIGIPASLILGFILLMVGSTLYSQTDEYKELMAQRENEIQNTQTGEYESKENEDEKNEIIEERTETTEERIEETEECSTEITKEEKFLKDLENVIDKNIAEKAYDILKNQIGFENMEYQKQMDGLTNYEIIADGYNIILTASDDVYRIFIPNSSYVFYENEEVIMTKKDLEDGLINAEDMPYYYSIAQLIVENYLISPKSANFPWSDKISYQKKGNLIAIKGYVDAQNSYGVEIRSNYIVQFYVNDLDDLLYETTYVNIDGQEAGQFVNMN